MKHHSSQGSQLAPARQGKIFAGLALMMFGIVGIVFFGMAGGGPSSVLLLFAPVAVLALGTVGLILGLLDA